jgi:hypothetical protein
MAGSRRHATRGLSAGTRLRIALPLLVAVCAVVVGGYARPAHSGGPSGGDGSRSQPHTVTVTARDGGRVVTLNRGERLDAALGIVRRTGEEWLLVSYPVQLLSLLPGRSAISNSPLSRQDEGSSLPAHSGCAPRPTIPIPYCARPDVRARRRPARSREAVHPPHPGGVGAAAAVRATAQHERLPAPAPGRGGAPAR